MSDFKHNSSEIRKKICVSVREKLWKKSKKGNLNISKICDLALEIASKGKLEQLQKLAEEK